MKGIHGCFGQWKLKISPNGDTAGRWDATGEAGEFFSTT
jgi:hypothetical protein